uniref:Uncharacterized protein n=1 Tax=Tetradesmus obliquus TaxID=3088 RepID=A0A383WGH9_TETOB|eukprot:jgi/Sobl393_1/3926/SZX76605.1
MPNLNADGNTNTTTKADKSAWRFVLACSSSQIEATKGGFASSWTYSNAKAVKGAADTCADAVSDAFSQTCSKANGVSAVSLAAEICANTIAKLYVSTTVKLNASENARVCANSCAISQSTASAVAAAVGQAITGAITPCAAVVTFVKSKSFVTSMTQAVAKSFTTACAYGEGQAYTQAAMMSESLATAYAKTFSSAMGKACSCSNCGCANIGTGDYSDDTFTDTSANVVSGKYALTTAVANAAHKLCNGDSVENSLKNLVNALVKVWVDANNEIEIDANATGKAFACAMTTANIKQRSMAEAAGDALSAAFAANFKYKCSAAVAALQESVTTSDIGDMLLEAIAATCSVPSAKGNMTSASYSNVVQYVTNSPLGDAVQHALATVAEKCECEGDCWCSTDCKTMLDTCPLFKDSAGPGATPSGAATGSGALYATPTAVAGKQR